MPLALAALAAVRAPRVHELLDYWHVLAKVTTDDGSLIPAQLFTYHLDQPFVLPSLLFWADAAWFGGDNRVLTLLTVAMMAAVVVLLRTMLPASLGPVKRATLTTAFAFLMLSSHAAELWLQGTNGISWVPAVLFSVLAIALAHHDRPWAACVAAAVGCLCFGAAFPAWFSIALVAWLRRSPTLKAVVPAIIGVVVFALWFATKPAAQQSLASSAFDPDGRLSVITAALGGLWSADVPVVAIIAGGITLAALVLLSWSPTRARAVDSAPEGPSAGWIGVALYAAALAVMLGLGRTSSDVPNGNVGLISRYVIVAALATCALLTLLALHRPKLPTRHLVAGTLTVALLTHAIGGTTADAVKRSYAPLQLVGVALRVNATAALNALHIEPTAIPAARALHDYPFTAAFTLGCGHHELGSHIDLTTVQVLPGSTSASLNRGTLDQQTTAPGSIISGWATISGTPTTCVLVTDGTGTVAGGGITGLDHPDAGTSGFQAVAAPNTPSPVVLVVAANVFYRVSTTANPTSAH
ncbi:DUF2079 domain-containing protein [Amycolatopsis sp.]|uniref:DUF2079 domain-containing protein n=1 Tax=Amycolatopsis sp. TaxID=37632 RepID=UPI00262DD927|nr:DUF2079 domain-containing protein [Amycolatopsis sp.]